MSWVSETPLCRNSTREMIWIEQGRDPPKLNFELNQLGCSDVLSLQKGASNDTNHPLLAAIGQWLLSMLAMIHVDWELCRLHPFFFHLFSVTNTAWKSIQHLQTQPIKKCKSRSIICHVARLVNCQVVCSAHVVPQPSTISVGPWESI